MRIAIDILHPAHVHFFKNFYFQMKERGHEFLITAREKDGATNLLDELVIPFHLISRSSRGGVRQAVEFARRSLAFARLMRRFKPDVLTGIMGPTIAVVGKIIRRPVYVFYDTEFAKTTNRFVYPMSTKVVTPTCYQGDVGDNQLTYPGYHELAYLHPNRFSPDADAVRRGGIDPDHSYAVVRFVGWWATHDRNECGLTLDQKISLVRELKQRMNVVITAEGEVPEEVAADVYRGPIENMHHVLAGADLYFGESATMASESAVLGTPAIYIAKSGRGYTDDEANYGLVHNFDNTQFDKALAKAIELADNSEPSAVAAARDRMLAEKIDVTQFMIDLFESDFATPVEAASLACAKTVN
ncbi:MAG: DUF354 domain-containing protein [Pirellulales bacterium]